MSLGTTEIASDTIDDVLESLRQKGVKLWVEGGSLRYEAPKGAMTQLQIQRLRACKQNVIARLESAAGVRHREPRLAAGPRVTPAPLAFSQLSHWNWHGLRDRPALRQIVSATRIRGALDVVALQESVAEVERRHDVLRTRIIVRDGAPMQVIGEAWYGQLPLEDLSALPEGSHDLQIDRRVDQLIFEPIDLAVGPLLGIALLRLSDDEHVLIVAMEHMISDAKSLGLLLREIFDGYVQRVTGRMASPTPRIQFSDYVAWQRRTHDSWIERHGAFWSKRLAGHSRLRFPDDNESQVALDRGWGEVPIRIGASVKLDLQDWCRTKRTTLVMTVFTAYVALVLRWCGVTEAVVRYQTDGRVIPETEDVIGFFASALHLRINIRESDDFVELASKVTREYCEAYEHADACYLAAQVPRLECTRNSIFNWVPRGAEMDLSALDGSGREISCCSIPLTHLILKKMHLDHEPGVVLYDTDEGIEGYVFFASARFSIRTMERFVRNFRLFLEALVRHPEGRVNDIPVT